jgi:hypothetical protein
MPYRRGGGCDICGARVPLERVVLRELQRAAAGLQLERVAYVCDAHELGEVVRPPARTMAAGTTRLRPQQEELF